MKPLDRITPAQVGKWFDRFSRTAPGNANHALDLLTQIINFAIARGHLETNPARDVERNPRRMLTRFLSREEISRLHWVLDSQTRKGSREQADIIRLLLLTGCRRNEIVRLRWPEVGVEMVHVGQSVGIDPRHQRRDGGKFRHVAPVDQHARGTGHRHEVQGQIGRPARGVQADHAVDEGALVEHRADGRVGIAGRGDLECAARRRSGQRVAERRAGIDEARAGQVQAHELHQHLVRVRRTVERAGAWAVIRGHLGGHQRVSADLAAGKALAHCRLLIVRQARGHRPRRREDRRDMAEGGCRDHQPGDDLVAPCRSLRVNETFHGAGSLATQDASTPPTHDPWKPWLRLATLIPTR